MVMAEKLVANALYTKSEMASLWIRYAYSISENEVYGWFDEVPSNSVYDYAKYLSGFGWFKGFFSCYVYGL
jgi:hypothetical protein